MTTQTKPTWEIQQSQEGIIAEAECLEIGEEAESQRIQNLNIELEFCKGKTFDFGEDN